jgi:hypothetical protein
VARGGASIVDRGIAHATLAGAREELLGRANVVATGVGFKSTRGVRTGDLSIVCSVERKLPAAQLAARDLVPPSIEGVPTDVVATGRLRALHDPTARHRPAPGGVSIGHLDVSAGTLGCLVRRGDDVFILSNNHVLAASNAGRAGDPILQPAVYDGGTDPEDRVAELADYVELRMAEAESGCSTARTSARVMNALARLLGSHARLRAVSQQAEGNLVDAAIARPLDAGSVSAVVAEIGDVAGVGRGELGLPVAKSGRTSGLTRGEIVQTDVTADVWYGEHRVRFVDQLMATGMSKGGDSGSAVFDEENRVVGLLFGGGEDATLLNRIEHVLAALDVEIPS